MKNNEELEFKYTELKNCYNKENLKLKKYQDAKSTLMTTILKNKQDIEVLNDLIESNNINIKLNNNKKLSKILAIILIVFGLGMTIVDSNLITFNMTRDLLITFLSSSIISGGAYLVNRESIIKNHNDKKYRNLQEQLNQSLNIKNQLNNYLKNLDYNINISNENIIEIASEIRKVANKISEIDNFDKIFNMSSIKTFQKKKEM